ncbi:hypothetical protein CDAR_431531 [Caerostris darwini]|uniref:Zinc finger CCHC-type and RNA-binding motif-containing protein 1 n=1 Tax=Caerostris darwini TaxID=1538125 RepID=A0AAV4T7U0_9ARAC|nr:hypothetical protein CDAR_431531 [Caerostris darwini]
MSGGFCPSKSTVYMSNLPFSLTHNDLHKIVGQFGNVVKVTICKDKVTKKNKGVAFILFMDKEGAQNCARCLNKRVLLGRTLKCSMAKDNGRATEFIRRRVYKDKSTCYECGEEGHLSYVCPKNVLGDRYVEKKEKKRKYNDDDDDYDDSEEESDQGEDPVIETLGAAILYERQKREEEEYRMRVATGQYEVESHEPPTKKKRFRRNDYFSDEEEIDDS